MSKKGGLGRQKAPPALQKAPFDDAILGQILSPRDSASHRLVAGIFASTRVGRIDFIMDFNYFKLKKTASAASAMPPLMSRAEVGTTN